VDSPKIKTGMGRQHATAEGVLLLALDEAVESGARKCHLRRNSRSLGLKWGLNQPKSLGLACSCFLNTCFNMFLHVLTCFNIFYHGLTHVNQQTCRIYSPTTWSFRYIMVHHGWCEKMGIAKTPWRTSASNICSFALPAGAVLSGAFPISDPLQPKKPS
jgi:hypothetical protein